MKPTKGLQGKILHNINKNILQFLAGLFLACLLLLPEAACSYGVSQWAHVKYVIDGDTIVLQNGRKVRYIGINAPEIAHKDKPGEPFGIEAREFNRKLVQNRDVRIIQAGDGVDRFGRILAYVFTKDGRMVNERLLKQGLAHVCFFSRDLKYRRLLIQAQLFAINARKGIWSLRPVRPEDFYIGNRRSQRFHRPSCKFGRHTSRNNKVIFKNRIAAFKKGYCPCKKCRP